MESQSRRSISIKGRWIYFLTLLLVLYLAAHIARAQDASPSQEPTPILTATDEVTVENAVGTDVSPIMTPPEITAIPTDSQTSVLVVADKATVEQTSEAEVSPTLTSPEITSLPTDVQTSEIVVTDDVSATPIAPEQTDLPTDTPIPTLVATAEVTDLSPSANISIAANTSHTGDNTLLTLTVSAEGLSDAYHVALACRVDSTVLQGVQVASGDMLLPDISTVTDTGFQPDGLWILISNQMDSAPALANAGTLWTISYQVVGTSATAINCQAEIRDQNKQPILLTNPNPSLMIDEYQAVITEPSPTPSVIETEVPIIVEATAEITETPNVVPVTSTPIDRFHISGGIESVLPLRQPSLTISGTAMNQVVEVQANLTYSADLPAGEYQFIFNALYCLPQTVAVTITDKPLRLPIVTLPVGDVDANGVINTADAMLITQNFGLADPMPPSADLNGDGVVNIYDLALVSANIHL